MAGSVTLFEIDEKSSSRRGADHEVAKMVAVRMEEHFTRFGEREVGFSFAAAELLTVPVMQRAARIFWNRHNTLWPTFSVTGTGVSLAFIRIRRR